MLGVKNKDDEKNLTIIGHLSELRKRLIYSAVVLIIAILGSYNFSEAIVRKVIDIYPGISFVFIAPAELLMSYIKISIISGIVISAPFLILQLWIFVRPGLTKKERRVIMVSLFAGGLFFLIGIVFSLLIVLPFMIQFFTGFEIEEIKEMISFSSYLGFVINTLLSFGIIFEMPIIMIILVKFNITNVKFLKKNRKYMVLIIFVLAAILTPPDVISQVLLALPMILLFEIGIFLSSLVAKKR